MFLAVYNAAATVTNDSTHRRNDPVYQMFNELLMITEPYVEDPIR